MSIAVGGILGVSALAGFLMAFYSRKLAGWVYVAGIPLIVACTIWSEFYRFTVPVTAVVSTVLLLLGGFWFWTDKSRWPHFAPQRKLNRSGKILMWVSISVILMAAVSLGSIKLTMMEEDIGDCGEGPPVYKHYPGQTVFVARVVHFDSWLGAVAVVQEHFWGLSRFSKIVFLKAPWEPGNVYFIAGHRSSGLLTSYIFPVISLHCSRSKPIQYAKADLRLLRGGSWQGVRIIGRTVSTYRGDALPGTKVMIEGPQGQVVTTSDGDGIYDVAGLPAGKYKVHADDDDIRFRERSACRQNPDMELKSGDVWGCTLVIFRKQPTS